MVERAVPKLIEFLDFQLAKTSQEASIGKISLWSVFHKRSDGSYRSFWIRWGELADSLVRSNIEFPCEVNYFRALGALGMKQPQLGILLGTLEACSRPHSVEELKRTSAKLFETSFFEQFGRRYS